jgi:hypothetical protein
LEKGFVRIKRADAELAADCKDDEGATGENAADNEKGGSELDPASA